MKANLPASVVQYDDKAVLRLIQEHARNGAKAHRAQMSAGSLLALWWHRWQQRRKMRSDLSGFTDEVLKDFGLTRFEARDAAYKPFWKA